MLLSETELRAALEPLLDRLLAERLRLFQLQFVAQVQALFEAAREPLSAWELQDGIHKIVCGQTAAEIFTALFEAGAALVGPRRALVVVHKEQAAVWRDEGLSLPARFPLAQREQLMAPDSSLTVRVRGKTVGYFCWQGAALPPAVAARLELLIQIAGLVMLEASLPNRQTVGPAAERSGVEHSAHLPAASSEAGQFAELLIEDLRLYLGRERNEDLGMGIRAGDWRERFRDEIKRCRQAFAVRYPSESDVFEGVVPRLGELPEL